jgi:large repetitive protein
MRRSVVSHWLFVSLFALLLAVPLQAALTVEPITWNVIGLDSNSPATGPNQFPIGARVCSDVATTNVSVEMVWDSANPFVDFRPGSLTTIVLPSIAAGSCADAYFEVEVDRDPAAFDTTRRYHIEATDSSGTVSTPTPRELYVEHLISQNRNSITDVLYGPVGGPLTSVAPGGGMALAVGETYDIQLRGGTATQGYEQFEAFINFTNTIFRIVEVETTYSADTSPNVSNPHPQLYADACTWENDPNSPNYRSCLGEGKAGGTNVVTTYTIEIIGGGGTSQTLNTLLYDFSGSSFHYNADFGTGARVATIIDPAQATLAKSFAPNPISVNGTSVLTITIGNPNAGAVSGYNFVDNLPAGLVIAAAPNASTSGCGTPTLTAPAGGTSISFSNGTVAGNGSCVIHVDVTSAAASTYNNTTNNLFVGTTNTGVNASASLTVTNETPATPLCGQALAGWAFPAGFNTATPVPSSGTGSAAAGAGVNPVSSTNSTTTADGTQSWGSNGSITTGATLVTANNEYFEFGIDTTGLSEVELTFDALRKTPNGPQGVAVFVGTTNTRPEAGASVFNNATALPAQNTWVTFGPITVSSGLNPAGTTFFRIYTYNSGNTNAGSDFNLDNVSFTGCVEPVDPTITKAFSADPIAVGGVSKLTFTLTNTNASALTGTTFSDTFPAGLQVAGTPNASTTCGGTWAPAAGATTVTLTGGTIPASGACTVSVDVTATAGGVHTNVSGIVTTTEGGTGDDTPATDTLTAVLPPSIAKAFAPSPILANGVSTLTFTVTNPNPDIAISGVAFFDMFPVAPGAMVVAAAPNSTVSAGCGAATFSASAGAGSVTFSNGSIAGGGTCVVTVDVTASAVGTYNNTTFNISHVVNAQSVSGNSASDSLVVESPVPALSILKQAGPTASGPWSPFLATATGGNVHFRFTLENTGDVPLTNLSITDDTLDVSACNAALSGITLEVPDALDENHLFTCVAGPVVATSGSHTNVASADGQFGATPVSSPESDAVFATTGLTLDKTATQTSFTNAGDSLDYSYLVTNSGFAPLEGPVTITDDKTAVSCPNVSTVGDLDNFLDPGESVTCTATYVIAGADVTAGFVTNTATATVDGVSSNSDSVTVVSTTSADLALTKTLTTAGPFNAGQPVSFTIAVTNNGPATATNVQVTDVPSNLTITSVAGGGCAALPCTIPSIAMGATVNITVTGTIVASGAFGNTATADGDQPDPDTTDNTDQDGDTAGSSADVAVVKTLTTAGPYSAGQSVTFNIDVTNNGPSTATGVDVTDTPTNLTITSVSGACASFPCVIASINSGATSSITVTGTINAAGAFENSATATPDQPDPTPGNNTDEDGDATGSTTADVSVVKTLTSVGPFTAGDTVSFTLTVANDGPATATNVQVTDTPANLTITGVSGSGCAALPCTIPALSSGTSTDIIVTATIDGPGAFLNTATVDATEPDPDPTDDEDEDGDTAEASANLSLVKTLTTAGPHFAGDAVSFTIVITNFGPSDATSVQVTDTPSNLSITGVSGSGCVTFPCTIPSIPAGTDTSITVTGTITAPGAFANTATATGAEPDPDPSDNTDDDGSATGPTADISLVKDLITAGPFTLGDSIDYTITISNAGPSSATDINVTDVPSNLTITGVSGSGCAAFPCTIASLAAGDATVIHVTATITAGGIFNNTATATAAEPDPDETDNTDEDGDIASPAAELSLTKTLTTAGPYNSGGSVSFDIVVSNAGPSTATNVQVTDTPSNFNITTVSGSGCAALPCTIPSLATGATATITVTGTIAAPGEFGNTATVTGDQEDPDLTNNTDEDGSVTTASADVSVVKTLETPGPYTVGDAITYLITVSNAGPSPATDVVVTDTPANLVIDSVSGAGCTAFPCTIPAIGVGGNAILTVSATITAAGPFSNTATVDATEPDPDTTDDEDDDGDTATGSADLAVQKILTTAAPFASGDAVQFTILVTNNGPSAATNVTVTDTPDNVTITSVAGSGCTAFPCTIPTLAAGDSATIEVTGTINAAGDFGNSTTVDADEPDPDLTDNTDEDGSTTGAAADVSVVKTLTTAGPYSPGQAVTFTVTVSNAGPSTATNVQVTDTPSNVTITSVSGSGCAAFPCTIASLAAGANTVINVGATITAAGPFSNSATVTADEPDPDETDNTDDDGDIAGPSADVSVIKTLTTAGPYLPGQSVSFTIQVSNAGPSPATNVQVTDTPSNLTITSVSGACAAFPCTIPNINAGASANITVTATIGTAGAFSNSATATATEPDPDTPDNTDEDGDIAGPSADVSVIKTLTTAGPYLPGQSVAFTIQVSNAGPSAATNVQVTDTPSNLTITGVSGACAAFPCTIPNINAGASTNITVTATIGTAGAFSNSATATATEPDPDTPDNTDDDEDIAGPSADVSVIKTLTTAGPYFPGQSVAFTIQVSNAGPSPATNVQVTDTPSNLTITGVSGACAAFPCTIPNINAGASANITVTATIGTAGAFSNSATATATEPDPDTPDNTDDDGDAATVGSVDLQIAKSASDMTLSVGQTFNFTLVVTNNGPDTATNVVVTDPLPPQFVLQTASSTQGTCSGTSTVTCNVGTMLDGATVTITLTGSANGPGTLVNTASVTSDQTETVITNNTSSTTPVVTAVTSTGIPTVSEWGLLMLAMSLAVAAALKIRVS